MIIRSLGRPLIVTLLAIATVAALVVSANSATQILIFIGFTGPADGNITLVGMNSRCYNAYQASYPGARACTSEEFLASQITAYHPVVSTAWVNPSIVAAFYDPSIVINGVVTGSEVYVDASGATALSAANLSCAQWTSNSSGQTGLAVQTTTGLGNAAAPLDCSVERYIACCAP